jgi:hypothetical protein
MLILEMSISLGKALITVIHGVLNTTHLSSKGSEHIPTLLIPWCFLPTSTWFSLAHTLGLMTAVLSFHI